MKPAAARRAPRDGTPERLLICVCTYQRNDRLGALLERCAEISDRSGRVVIGVVVADDNPDASAAAVTDRFTDRFPLGVHHVRSGARNISVARNHLLDTALELGDLLVMTDDDCLPDLDWVDRLLDVRRATAAHVVSGVTENVPGPGAARWVTEQDAFDFTRPALVQDEARLEVAQTNNCLIDLEWLADHPELRFDPEFGRIGGEDMVFFRAAAAAGMHARHAAGARVVQVERAEDCTFGALLRTSLWLGNTEAVTNLTGGTASRSRLALRAARRGASVCPDVLGRVVHGRPPHLRRAAIHIAGAAGLLVGAIGVKVRHH